MPDNAIIAYAHVYFDREGGGSLSTFIEPAAALASYKTEVENAYDTSESTFYLVRADGSNEYIASGGDEGPSTPDEAVELVRKALNL